MVRKGAITLAVAFSAVLAAAATIDKRIEGGEEAKEGEFPFLVRLNYKERPATVCGGSLLDSTTVLTAAHCLDAALVSVRAGSLNKDTGGVVAEVKSQSRHPDHEFFKRKNDIAILKLSTPIEESKTISYAKLPASGSDPATGSTAVAAGWGLNSRSGVQADKLLKVAVSIRAPLECLSNRLRQDPDYANNLDTKVCAGDLGMDTQKGDSGGPLIDQETGQLIGVTSFADTNLADRTFYTKVSRYMPFINENVGDSVPRPVEPEPSPIEPEPSPVDVDPRGGVTG